jgi:hypothetical protein
MNRPDTIEETAALIEQAGGRAVAMQILVHRIEREQGRLDIAADKDVARWNGQSLSSGQLAKVYGFTGVDGSQPDAWRYVVEVQDAGKPADTTGYR